MILAPKHLPRLAATVGLFTRYGLLDFAKQQGLLNIRGTSPEDGGAGEDSSHDKAKAFKERLVELGPAYIKLGQVLSTRPDLLPAAYIEELAHTTDKYTSAYPNAGLPDPLSATGFPETPETLAPQLREWAANGWLNIVGGCCGTTPAHIRAIAEAVREFAPRKPSVIPSEVEGPRGATFKPSPRDSSIPLPSARNERRGRTTLTHEIFC